MGGVRDRAVSHAKDVRAHLAHRARHTLAVGHQLGPALVASGGEVARDPGQQLAEDRGRDAVRVDHAAHLTKDGGVPSGARGEHGPERRRCRPSVRRARERSLECQVERLLVVGQLARYVLRVPRGTVAALRPIHEVVRNPTKRVECICVPPLISSEQPAREVKRPPVLPNHGRAPLRIVLRGQMASGVGT